MDTLPAEIICDIFLKSLPSPRSKDRSFQAASISTPLWISHVCRDWRAMALSLGELWSFLCINYNKDVDNLQMSKLVEIFDTWLSRTNNVPLNYTFICKVKGVNDAEIHHGAKHIITTLLSEQRRWKDVEVDWGGVRVSQVLEMTNMPMLTSLSISADLSPSVKISLARSPRLGGLRVIGAFDLEVGDEVSSFLLEAVSIGPENDLSVIGSLNNCLSLLQRAPFLRELDASFIFPFFMPRNSSYSGRPILLQELRAMNMVVCDASMAFLDILTLPSLKALRYTQIDLADTGSMLLSFVQRSRPPLTWLSLGEDTVNPDQLMSVLRLLPSLRHLRCKGVSVSRSVFLLLSVVSNSNEANAGDRTICPLLETLHLQASGFLEDREETLEVLVEMLRSRAKIQESFRTIRTYLNGKRDQILTIDISNLHEHLDDLWIDDPFVSGQVYNYLELNYINITVMHQFNVEGTLILVFCTTRQHYLRSLSDHYAKSVLIVRLLL
ncbi:hypothetical protein ACEPAG_9036 [Sanghuangporus baumii]